MHFDGRGRLTKTVTIRPTSAGNLRFVLEPRYNEHDQRVGLVVTFPGGARDSIGYSFDGQQRPSGVYDWSNQTTAIGYNADGQPGTITLPGGRTITYTYASNHLPGSIHYNSSALNAAAGLGLEYDALNRVALRWNGARDQHRLFQYGAAGALSSYTDVRATGTTKPTCTFHPDYGEVCEGPTVTWTNLGGASYAFDAVGNPTDRGATLGGGNRLAAFDGYSLTYDFDGNLTRKRLTASSSQFDQHLTWNPVGQLTQVATTRQGVTTTVGYGYDGLGRRVRTTNPDGSVTSVLYDGDDLLLELAGDGSVRVKYMYYPGIDYPHSVVRGTQTAYFATDQVGSVSALFNSAGQVLNRYTYEPFGEMETVSEQIVNPLRFTAREYDAITNLYYYRNRWYDPHLGRFISEDPIGLAGGINVYAYVANDPVNFADPTGLICLQITKQRMVRTWYTDGSYVDRPEGPPQILYVGDCTQQQVDGAEHAGRGGRRRTHGRCEVAGFLRDYLAALRSNPLSFASEDYPARFDYKFGGTANDLFQVGNQWMRADEFGNYAAGYAGQHAYREGGHIAMIAGGIYFASRRGSDGRVASGEHWTDRESRPMINAGAARARLEQDSNGGVSYHNHGVRARAFVQPLTSTVGCN